MLLFYFFLLITCKYMVCSHRCIVVTIDGALYDVDVDKQYWPPLYDWNIVESGIKHYNTNP